MRPAPTITFEPSGGLSTDDEYEFEITPSTPLSTRQLYEHLHINVGGVDYYSSQLDEPTSSGTQAVAHLYANGVYNEQSVYIGLYVFTEETITVDTPSDKFSIDMDNIDKGQWFLSWV